MNTSPNKAAVPNASRPFQSIGRGILVSNNELPRHVSQKLDADNAVNFILGIEVNGPILPAKYD